MRHRTNATSTPVGILRPDQFATHVDIEIVPCASELSRWVEHYWCLAWDLPAGTTYISSVLPHPACNLSVEHGPARPGVGADRVVVTGVVTRRFDVPLSERGSVLGVRFRPGGLSALCGPDARDLTDRVVPAIDVLPSGVCDAMREIPADASNAAACAATDQALAALVPEAQDAAYAAVGLLVADMLDDRTIVRVEQLVERHGMSRRHIERLFARYVGVGPKWVLARYRMHDVVAVLDAGYDGSLTDLAVTHGWYDQAHFTRDFTRLVGVTPGEYRST